MGKSELLTTRRIVPPRYNNKKYFSQRMNERLAICSFVSRARQLALRASQAYPCNECRPARYVQSVSIHGVSNRTLRNTGMALHLKLNLSSPAGLCILSYETQDRRFVARDATSCFSE